MSAPTISPKPAVWPEPTFPPVVEDLDMFTLDPLAWSPRKAVFRVAYASLASRGRSITPQQLYALLRSRHFKETRRRGQGWGFEGIRTPDEFASLPRLVPADTSSAYRRGSRTPAAKRARAAEKLARRAQFDESRDPLLTPGRTPVDALSSRATELEALHRRYRGDSEIDRAEYDEAAEEAAELEAALARIYPDGRERSDDWNARRLREVRENMRLMLVDKPELARYGMTLRIAPLKREARELEDYLAAAHGGDVPDDHPDAVELRELRDRIDTLYAELAAI